MIVGHNILFINSLFYSCYFLFFSLDGKEPKDPSGAGQVKTVRKNQKIQRFASLPAKAG